MEGTRVPVEDDRSLSSFPAGEQTVWADVSPLLDAVCDELQVGELIHGENFSLFEAMSALEIMDPKMDAGMTTCRFNSVEEAIASGAAPIWLSVSQTIDVMDHLLACEATWHKGHSLAQTVFSCLYLLNTERTSPNSLLHAYCRIIRGTCNIIRSAVSKSRTHEEEDLFTMAFGLPLKGDGDDKCLSMLNAVEETIARQLRACKNSKKKVTEDYEPLQKDPNLEEGFCKAVLSRLRFRKAFYHILAYMEKPQGRGLEMAHKHIILGLSELSGIRESSNFLSSSSEESCKVSFDNSTTASGQAAVGFDANINSRLLAPTPPRLIKPSDLNAKYGEVPGLAVVIVGEKKDSQTYVRMKRKACAEVGIKSFDVDLPGDASEEKVLDTVLYLNADPQIHGILVQLPLPPHVNEEKILSAISIEKDVDGFHPLNIGKLAMKGREPLFVPCTPKGCIELLVRSGVSIPKKRAVVVGRSNIVGLPVALLLIKLDATVTIVHSRTPDPKSIVSEADIIIAAAGQAHMIKGDWIKPGAAVIDVGTNAVTDPSRKSGYRLVGDVDFEEAKEVAEWITPVPGGVGPMTIAMLLKNTLDGAKRAFEEK